MLSNRESARQSHARKQQRLEELVAEVACLQAENAQVQTRIATFEREFSKVDSENATLRARHGELAGRLESLSGVLEVLQMAGAPVVDHRLFQLHSTCPRSTRSSTSSSDSSRSTGFRLQLWSGYGSSQSAIASRFVAVPHLHSISQIR
jgi:hypothetical protein